MWAMAVSGERWMRNLVGDSRLPVSSAAVQDKQWRGSGPLVADRGPQVVGGEEAASWEAGRIGAGDLCHIVAVPPRAYLRSQATTS